MIKLLIKVRLMLSRIEQNSQNWIMSLKLLWKNINLLKMEACVRMNEFMEGNDTESPKMIKWSKFFITNLFQMINVFVQLEELELANECAKLIEWLSKCFFDRNSIIYLSMMDYLDSFFDGIGYHLGLKHEMNLLINRAINKHFHLEDMEGFLQKEKTIKTEYGYIPTAKESSVLKEMEENDSKMKNDPESLKNDRVIRSKSTSMVGGTLFKLTSNKPKLYQKPIGGKKKFKSSKNLDEFKRKLTSHGSFTQENFNSESQFGSFLSNKPNGQLKSKPDIHKETGQSPYNGSGINFKKGIFTNQSISTHLASKLSNGQKDDTQTYDNYNLLNSPQNYFDSSSKDIGKARIIVKNPKYFKHQQHRSQALETNPYTSKELKEGKSLMVTDNHRNQEPSSKEPSYNHNRNVQHSRTMSNPSKISALSRRKLYGQHIDQIRKRSNRVKRNNGSRVRLKGRSSSLKALNRSNTSFKINKGTKVTQKLADIVSRTKSDIDYYEKQKPKIREQKKDMIYKKHSHKFMITETLQKMLKKEERKKPSMLGADLFFSDLISTKMVNANGSPYEFDNNKEVKINKMKHIQKDLLFTTYQTKQMDYKFDRKRIFARKREENERTDYPDMQRAANPNDMNVST